MSATPPDAGNWLAPTWCRLAVFALATRLVTLVVGILLGPAQPGDHWTTEQLAFRAEILGGPVPWLEPWVRFDAGFYLAIAREGYHPPADGEGPNAGFLPLLPALVALAAAVGVNPVLAGVLIPNVAFVAALACAGRAALRVTYSARSAWLGCGVLTTYPFAFYFSAPYQESLYLLAAAGGLLAWYDRRPALAGLAGMFAATARLTAVAFPVGLFVEAVTRRQWPSRGAWMIAMGTATGVALFGGWMWVTLGDPLAHFRAHAAWGRESPSLGGVGRALLQAARELVQWERPYPVVKPIVLFGTFALGIRGWVKRGPLWGCLILIPVGQALSTGTTLSIERIVLTCFPAAFELGEVLGRSRMMQLAWLVVAVRAQLFFLWLFVNNGFLN
ncbi:MAG: hypothetical protein U0804_28200 [Gemmataceae bacterium]